MTAKQVNINTQAHTQLTGSLIAATDTGDKDGNDNGQSMLSWLVACRLAPLILASWVVLRLMLVAVRLVLLWVVC
jgi:hypothetical protein